MLADKLYKVLSLTYNCEKYYVDLPWETYIILKAKTNLFVIKHLSIICHDISLIFKTMQFSGFLVLLYS